MNAPLPPEVPPRTRRFMRELSGFGLPSGRYPPFAAVEAAMRRARLERSLAIGRALARLASLLRRCLPGLDEPQDPLSDRAAPRR